MRVNLKFITLIASIVIALFFTACQNSNDTSENIDNTGDIVDTKILNEVNASTNLAYIQANIIPNALDAFAYKSIKIKYRTKDEQDNDVIASGVLVYPEITQAFSVPLVLDNHGTIFLNAEAPSSAITTSGTGIQALATSMVGLAGFAVAFPDYLGYGDSSDKNHPYILKKSSAKVSIDMLRAAKRYMTDHNIKNNGDIYISGYSEGGYVAMATAKEIEANYSDEFTVKALAAMAGPYDLAGLADKEIEATTNMEDPAFLAYLASSYSIAYDDIDLQDITVEQNTTKFNSLFDGNKNATQIHIALGLTNGNGYRSYRLNALFQNSFINDYKNNINNSFKRHLEQNSVYDWKPNMKVNLIHCIDDEIIPISLAQTAYDKFIANGDTNATITFTEIPSSALSQPVTSTHAQCGNMAYRKAIKWFMKIRSE